jgi:hypothetical protein
MSDLIDATLGQGEWRMAEKQGTVAKLGMALVKAAGLTAQEAEMAVDVDPKDHKQPGRGPDDKPVDRESVEIVRLPHFG